MLLQENLNHCLVHVTLSCLRLFDKVINVELFSGNQRVLELLFGQLIGKIFTERN